MRPSSGLLAAFVYTLLAGFEVPAQCTLLTSDIGARDEALLLARTASALEADVLLVSHHGSRTSSMPDFIAAVHTREGLIAVGFRNRFGHPKAEVIESHAMVGSLVWCTDRNGAVSIRLGPSGDFPEVWRLVQRFYWQNPDGGVAVSRH